MALGEILGVSGAGIIVVLFALIKVKPLEISIWSWIARKVGKALNGETNDRLDAIEKTLNAHIETDKMNEILHIRTMILRFADEMYDGKRHSKEHFEDIIDKINEYDAYCNEHKGFKNGRTEYAEKLIFDQYDECFKNKSFMEEA